MVEMINIDDIINNNILGKTYNTITRKFISKLINICNKYNIDSIVVNMKFYYMFSDSFNFRISKIQPYNTQLFLVGSIYNISVWLDDRVDDNIYIKQDIKKKRLNKLNNILTNTKSDSLEMIKIIDSNNTLI